MPLPEKNEKKQEEEPEIRREVAESSKWSWAKKYAGYIAGGIIFLYFLALNEIIEVRVFWVAVAIIGLIVLMKAKVWRFFPRARERPYELPDPMALGKQIALYFLLHKGDRLMPIRWVGDPELGASSHTPNVMHFLFKKYDDKTEAYTSFAKAKVSVYDWKSNSFGIIDYDDDFRGVETRDKSWFGGTKYPLEERERIYSPAVTKVVVPRGEEESEYYEEE